MNYRSVGDVQTTSSGVLVGRLLPKGRGGVFYASYRKIR